MFLDGSVFVCLINGKSVLCTKPKPNLLANDMSIGLHFIDIMLSTLWYHGYFQNNGYHILVHKC